jgi:excisionase family DNA binding protein
MGGTALSDDRTDKDLLTAAEAAPRLGIGRTKIYELMDAGELRSIRIVRSRRIPVSEIGSFIVRKLKEAEDA